MRRINGEDSKRWLVRLGATISSNRDIEFSTAIRREQHQVFAKFPTDGRDLTYFAACLVDWLPKDIERLLWLKNWNTEPNWHRTFFEQARNSLPNEHLIDTPGHIFAAEESNGDADTFGNESSAAAGFLFLTMCFDWDAYFLAQNTSDCVYVTDEHAYLMSDDSSRIKQAKQILESFQLKVKVPR